MACSIFHFLQITQLFYFPRAPPLKASMLKILTPEAQARHSGLISSKVKLRPKKCNHFVLLPWLPSYSLLNRIILNWTGQAASKAGQVCSTRTWITLLRDVRAKWRGGNIFAQSSVLSMCRFFLAQFTSTCLSGSKTFSLVTFRLFGGKQQGPRRSEMYFQNYVIFMM